MKFLPRGASSFLLQTFIARTFVFLVVRSFNEARFLGRWKCRVSTGSKSYARAAPAPTPHSHKACAWRECGFSNRSISCARVASELPPQPYKISVWFGALVASWRFSALALSTFACLRGASAKRSSARLFQRKTF